jgi:hypothetical protein
MTNIKTGEVQSREKLLNDFVKAQTEFKNYTDTHILPSKYGFVSAKQFEEHAEFTRLRKIFDDAKNAFFTYEMENKMAKDYIKTDLIRNFNNSNKVQLPKFEITYTA